MFKYVISVLLVLSVAPCMAATVIQEHDIHIEWTYDYQPVEGRELAGFKLYKDELNICNFKDPDIREGDCKFMSLLGTYKFTLTAVTDTAHESLASPIYKFALTEGKLNTPVMQIRFIIQ